MVNIREKEAILNHAFYDLRAKIVKSAWQDMQQPFTNLWIDCTKIMQDRDLSRSINDYLQSRSIIRRSVTMFFTYLAMSERADWESAEKRFHGITARGWFLGRWLPTFLILDGPIGRFLNGTDSPLTRISSESYPSLNAAREFLKYKEFIQLRNGFAHWGFDWEVVGKESYIVAYNWETDLPIVKLHQKEAEAYQIISFSVIEILNDTIINPK